MNINFRMLSWISKAKTNSSKSNEELSVDQNVKNVVYSSLNDSTICVGLKSIPSWARDFRKECIDHSKSTGTKTVLTDLTINCEEKLNHIEKVKNCDSKSSTNLITESNKFTEDSRTKHAKQMSIDLSKPDLLDLTETNHLIIKESNENLNSRSKKMPIKSIKSTSTKDAVSINPFFLPINKNKRDLPKNSSVKSNSIEMKFLDDLEKRKRSIIIEDLDNLNNRDEYEGFFGQVRAKIKEKKEKVIEKADSTILQEVLSIEDLEVSQCNYHKYNPS